MLRWGFDDGVIEGSNAVSLSWSDVVDCGGVIVDDGVVVVNFVMLVDLLVVEVGNALSYVDVTTTGSNGWWGWYCCNKRLF